jgi:hypothetical protein
VCLFGLVGALGPIGTAAAEPPQVVAVSVEGVSATGATLSGSIDAKGVSTTYRFEYLTAASYEANLAASLEPFTGAAFAPSSGKGLVGSGSTSVSISQHLSGLIPSTAYRFRLRAANVVEEAGFSPVRPFATAAPTNVFEPLDHRGWEMVSPIDKAGGAIQAPESIFGGGVFQAAVAGGAVTYSSADSFGAGAEGTPVGSQYIATLSGGGWTTINITTPLLSGSYGNEPEGVPYQVFSSNLGNGLLSNGERCRGNAGGECPVANPPLPGSGAPAGYRDYYRRGISGLFASILAPGDLSHTALTAAQFELRLVGATPDLEHVVVSSCAALTGNATEVDVPGGCEAGRQNLYEWSGGELSLVSLLPGQTTGSPGATIAAASGAISSDGSRVYFELGKDLYLREAGQTKLVDGSLTGAEFEVASAEGSIAFVLDAGNLYRYDAESETLTALTASGEVEGVLGASPDGARVFYVEPAGAFMREGSTTERIAGGADVDHPPATGTARVSANGKYVLFASGEELTAYPNEGDGEVYLYGPAGEGSATLVCVSCNPTGERPTGGASIPGAMTNGAGPDAFAIYKPRVLSETGRRVFFDSSDSLVPQDTNHRPDVYEWEAAGEGTCAQVGGCVQLISTGRSEEASIFLDASADGSEAFFLTSESIYPLDPGSYDVYDARVGGGFTVPASPTVCEGDSCQALPEAPEDPTPGTLTPNSGNPPLGIAGKKATQKKAKEKRGRKKHHSKKHKKTHRKHSRGSP